LTPPFAPVSPCPTKSCHKSTSYVNPREIPPQSPDKHERKNGTDASERSETGLSHVFRDRQVGDHGEGGQLLVRLLELFLTSVCPAIKEIPRPRERGNLSSAKYRTIRSRVLGMLVVEMAQCYLCISRIEAGNFFSRSGYASTMRRISARSFCFLLVRLCSPEYAQILP